MELLPIKIIHGEDKAWDALSEQSPEDVCRRAAVTWDAATGQNPLVSSLRLFPLPRVPVTLVLWLRDEEFPPRMDLLFDSTCDLQISLSDIIWSIAMMFCLVML